MKFKFLTFCRYEFAPTFFLMLSTIFSKSFSFKPTFERIANKMQCLNRDKFCFVCSLYTTHKHKNNITNELCTRYRKRFSVDVPRDNWYVPNVMCVTCRRSLDGTKGAVMKFAAPTKWLQRDEHVQNTCYFCVSVLRTRGFKYNQRHLIEYYESAYVVRPELQSGVDITDSTDGGTEIENIGDDELECDVTDNECDTNYESNENRVNL